MSPETTRPGGGTLLSFALLAVACSAPRTDGRSGTPEVPPIAMLDDERVAGPFHDGTRPLRFEVPAGWAAIEGDAAEGVLASYRVGDRSICTVSASTEHDEKAQLDRLCRRIGQAALMAEERAAVPRVEVLDREARRLRLVGTLSVGSPRDPSQIDDAALLGLIVSLPGETLAVSLAGPRDEVRAHEGAFDAFCASLR